MEFHDLKRQYNALREEIVWRVGRVAEEGRFIGGCEVEELEERLARYAGVRHCVSCGNGTDALTLMFAAAGIGRGDAVFLPDFTFFATAEAVSRVGAEPVFVQPDADTFNISPDALVAEIARAKQRGANARAILAVDLFGLPADWPQLEKIAAENGLLLFEDAAQGFGGELDGRRACSFGLAAATSFFPAKPLGCYGDGGAVFTDDDGLAELIRSLREHGRGKDKYENLRIGCNSRLDTVQAAVLLAKLEAFRRYELTAVRRAASLYTDGLRGLRAMLQPPCQPLGFRSAWAQYTVRFREPSGRAGAVRRLRSAGIPSAVYYPRPVSRQEAYRDFAPPETTVSDELCGRVLSLPIHPYITDSEIELVCAALRGLGLD